MRPCCCVYDGLCSLFLSDAQGGGDVWKEPAAPNQLATLVRLGPRSSAKRSLAFVALS